MVAKRIVWLFSIFVVFSSFSIAQIVISDKSYDIPCAGNAFITYQAVPPATKQGVPSSLVTSQGLVFYKDAKSKGSIYFYVSKPCNPHLSLNLLGQGTLKVSYGEKNFKIKINSPKLKVVEMGVIAIKSPGYIRLDLQVDHFDDLEWPLLIKDLILNDISFKPLYIGEKFSSHFGRRGPSVYLNYPFSSAEKVEWFYNEVMVPKEGDEVGSYYCAQSFNIGYFGFQNNAKKLRRVLFSVWSPYSTQNPNNIPVADRVKLVKKGAGVTIGKFGNEGSGAQSYLEYPWKPGNTYRFLVHIHPSNQDSITRVSAYFYAPEEGKWRLVASFDRPKTHAWITNTSSFLENFIEEKGYLSRKAFFGNVWAITNKQKWIPINHITTSNDDTARHGIRVDYLAGSDDKKCFLKMGGFFGDGSIAPRTFEVEIQERPVINLEKFK